MSSSPDHLIYLPLHPSFALGRTSLHDRKPALRWRRSSLRADERPPSWQKRSDRGIYPSNQESKRTLRQTANLADKQRIRGLHRCWSSEGCPRKRETRTQHPWPLPWGLVALTNTSLAIAAVRAKSTAESKVDKSSYRTLVLLL